MIAESSIREIRSRANQDIADLVGEDIELTRKGGEFTACCPFHEDATPSFFVVPDKGFFNCFGCGASGDAFAWMERQRGLSFKESVAYFAERYGIALVEERTPADLRSRAADEGRSRLQEILSAILGLAAPVDGVLLPSAEGPLVLSLPGVREVASRLKAMGYASADLAAVGLRRSLQDVPAWSRGGPIIWAGERHAPLAIQPLARGTDLPVLGMRGAESAGWVNLTGAVREGRRGRRLSVAADIATFARLQNLAAVSSTTPIGKPSAESFALLAAAADRVRLFCAPNAHSRKIAYALGLELAGAVAEVSVLELEETQDQAVVCRRLEHAAHAELTLFEWQASLLESHGMLRSDHGRERGADRLIEIIDRLHPEKAALERDMSAEALERITGIRYEEGASRRHESERGQGRAVHV